MFIFALRWLLTASAFAHGTILPARMLQDLSRRANASTERYERMEAVILTTRSHLAQGTPAWYFGASHEILPEARNLSRRAIRSETVATMLVEAMNMTANEAATVLPSMGVATALLCDVRSGKSTVTAEDCHGLDLNSKYRTQSGRCNNPSHPTWGSALGAYTRLLPAEYADGVSLPRLSNLPSARDISVGVHSGGPDQPHPYLMALAALFGQFVAHDLSHTPKVELPDGARLKCCDVDYEHFHPECFPIKVNDQSTAHCMEYARSAPHPGDITREGCRLGPRQQINQATSFLDLSPVYGISKETTRALRSGIGGLLKTQRKDLPMPSTRPENCRSNTPALPCFFSGDARINEHPGLALIHVLFHREHNKVAAELQSLNPHWNDETLFQEARRIVIAELQHITYNEFLPVVLGESALDRWNLRLTLSGYFGGYDPRVDATLSNAAASAGLLFVAAITPKTLDLIDTRSIKYVKSGERTLLSSFYAPQELYEAGALDRLIAGATAGHSRKPIPPGLNEILLGRYFHDGKSAEVPIDLAAQLIQRCRDHGLPSYTKWRAFCGLANASTFEDLRGTVPEEAIGRLRRIYRVVTDVDLVTGAFAEAPSEGSVVGPTFSCLLGRTFRNIRMGDRYWYENGNTPGAFSLKQLEKIRSTSMARILCDNGDRLGRVQPRSFILTDPFLNPMSNCSTYGGRLDLAPWIDRPAGS